MKYAIRILVVVSLFLVGTTTALAMKPLLNAGSMEFDACVDGWGPVDCGGGNEICEIVQLDFTEKLFFDKEENPVKYWVPLECTITTPLSRMMMN